MQKVLGKRVLRNLRRHLGRYGALFLLVALSVFMLISLLGAAQNVIDGTKDHARKNCLEGGEWETFVPLTAEELETFEEEGVLVEEQFYLDYREESGALVRLMKDREAINLVELDAGRKASEEDEIVLEKRFMEVHALEIGSRIRIGDRTFTITGIGTSPDYESPVRKMSDSTIDSSQFGTGFVTAKAYETMKASGTYLESEKYIYAYQVPDGSLDDEAVRDLVEALPFDWKKAEDPYFRTYVKEQIGDSRILLDLLSSPLMKGDENAEKFRSQIEPDIHNLQAFVPRQDNMRIGGAGADVEINKYASFVAGIIILILFAYVFAVFTIHEIDAESSVIGALYSLGVCRKDLLLHYMLLPALVTALGGAAGTFLAYTPIGISYQMQDTFLYYSVPALEIRSYAYILVYGLLLPPLMAALVNLLVIRKKLSGSALFLLRGGRKNVSGRQLDLGRMGFISRFRIRRILRELRAGLTMAFGLYVSLSLVFIAVDCYVMCRHVETDNVRDTHYGYMYTYKYPEQKAPEEGVAAYARTFSKERFGYSLDVTLLGTDDSNPYFDAAVPQGRKKVAISSAMAQKYGIGEGETLVLEDREAQQLYAFQVDSVFQYSAGFLALMDIDEMRDMFDAGEDYYNVVFSDKALEIDSGRLAAVLGRDQIEQAAHVFVDLMGSMILFMTLISAFIFFVVLYLMMGVMVDRASYDISLMKIFGYRKGEIRKLYLNGNLYIVAGGALVAIPLAKLTIDSLYPYFISNVACGMDLTMSPLVYAGIFAVIMAMYFVINALLVRKIDRVTPAEVLKNRE